MLVCRERAGGRQWVGVLAVGSVGQGNAGSRPWAAPCLIGFESLSIIDALMMRGGVDSLRMLCYAWLKE